MYGLLKKHAYSRVNYTNSTIFQHPRDSKAQHPTSRVIETLKHAPGACHTDSIGLLRLSTIWDFLNMQL